jgi:hypothetical protein
MTHPRWKRHLALAALVAAPVLGGGAAVAAPPGAPPSAADVTKATDVFKKATELFRSKKFVPALDHFKQSYALVPSPNSHLYIARCLAALGQARAAWLEFDRTSDEASAGGPKYAPTHDSALQERDELSAKLALVTVSVQPSDPAMVVRVGPYDVPPDRWGKPYPVDPGPTEVSVEIPGKPAIRQPISVARGERRDVALNAGPSALAGPVAPPPGAPGAPEPRRPINGLRIGAYVAAGVGVVGFVLLGVEGAASKSTYNTLDTDCAGKQGCPNPVGGRANANSLISTGNSQQTIANVGLGVGLVGIAAGAALFVLSTRRHPSDAGPPAAELVVGPTWAGARGSF